ncbi:MAG TPA: hypothetical protein VM939_11285 [Gemmatimonadaceae bacterium]|nr:hypothetical protein [Gemmatimonadaceae bacterium]
MHSNFRRHAALSLLTLVGLSCRGLPSRPAPQSEFWFLPAPDEPPARFAIDTASRRTNGQTVRVLIDSISLRPLVLDPPRERSASSENEQRLPTVAVVTSYQGDRYHPETVRALGEDSDVRGRMAAAITRLAGIRSKGPLVIDFQGMTADDLPIVMEVSRAIADSARKNAWGPIGFIVPAADTLTYPHATLGRIADLIVVRLTDEHRPGTPPGPLASPDWLSRQLAVRITRLGAGRVVAELPVFGYRWERGGSARIISFAAARSAVAAEAGAFRRDDVSGFLTASSARDGWEIWIADATTIRQLVARARTAGVTKFALAGIESADPAILDLVGASAIR